ncbi:MAG TPA: adenosylmethionine--8-amino-7-oxononanoate transaminase [Polyangiaceae bacterium]|jgi:adenosylmethionine-8-amino-7-oxononanoate aminotransferase|nr:adenosylmethionine--8-amino-7-oxononanoate transaminase [Polyangiaceae bacterium]
MASDEAELLALDRAHVWHPYASAIDPFPPYVVESADGVRLRLADGRELVDGMSSWWAAIHGYGVPELKQALTDQAGRMTHVMLGGLTHEPVVRLCERLVELTPEPLTRVFMSDSGSVAVEVALKMALQYWQSRGRPRKGKLLAVRGGYHGDTLGAMSVCDPVTGMHSLFRSILPEQLFADAPACGFAEPWSDAHAASLESMLGRHADDIAAVVFEPIVQGAGGMRFHSPGFVRRARELCDRHDVLLVLDEIATGFGRTGKLFACEHAGVAPDILCLGKALTGGTMSLAATLCTENVARVISGAPPHALMHGPTFMGNPLAASVALASIELLLGSPWRERVARIEAQLERELAPCRQLPGVADVRVLGAIGVVELTRPVDMRVVTPAFVARGAWLRPFGKLVYTMPPFVIDPADLTLVTRAIYEVVREHCG